MIHETIEIAAWRALLTKQGHDVVMPMKGEMAVALRPAPEKIVTVALETDVACSPNYRQRYFVCQPEPEQVFSSLSCPEDLRARWLELVSQHVPSYWRDFLAGPGSWVLTRLARFERVVVWSDRALAPWPIHAVEHVTGKPIPDRAMPFFSSAPLSEPFGPRLTAVRQPLFADTLAGCFLLSNIGGPDLYIADAAAREVYLIVNDEFVIASLPDAACREQIVQELRGARPALQDVSDFPGSMDDD